VKEFRVPFSDDRRLLADAVFDDGALEELLRREPVEATFELIARNRLGPLIARRSAGFDMPSVLRERLRGILDEARVRWTLFGHELGNVGRLFGELGIPWMPIKGGDLAFRVCEVPDDRVASDLDVLVEEARFEEALEAMLGDGWRSVGGGVPAFRRYVLEEGHNWPLARGPVPLELHLRLWGRAQAEMAAEIIAAGLPAPDLGPTARRPRLEHALAMAGIHSWMVLRPRPIATWLDQVRIVGAGGREAVDGAVDAARRWGLELQLGMAAAVASTLWPAAGLSAAAESLLSRVRAAERVVANVLCKRGVDAVDDRAVVLARLLARRPSRQGWRSVWRRVRPHPGVKKID
jgi:hypothetical protein